MVDYEPSLASLPDGRVAPVPLDGILVGEERKLLVDFADRLLLDSEEVQTQAEQLGPIPELYCGRRIRGCRRTYVDFTGRLHSGRLVLNSSSRKSRATSFFVKKKNGWQRRVLDRRATNRYFRRSGNLRLGAVYY